MITLSSTSWVEFFLLGVSCSCSCSSLWLDGRSSCSTWTCIHSFVVTITGDLNESSTNVNSLWWWWRWNRGWCVQYRYIHSDNVVDIVVVDTVVVVVDSSCGSRCRCRCTSNSRRTRRCVALDVQSGTAITITTSDHSKQQGATVQYSRINSILLGVSFHCDIVIVILWLWFAITLYYYCEKEDRQCDETEDAVTWHDMT